MNVSAWGIAVCAAATLVSAPALAQDASRAMRPAQDASRAMRPAQDASRANRWEFNVGARYIGSQSVQFDNSSKADVEGSWGFMMGLAYNFNNHLSLGGEMSWSSMDYTGTLGPSTGTSGGPTSVRGTAYTTSGSFNAIYHFLSGPVTPYISGTVGIVYLDTGIPSGPPVTGCWWYPWYWGYICGPVVPTKTSTDWTYGVGAGVRWDINEKFFVRAGVQQVWWSAGIADGTPSFPLYRADFGFKF